MVLTPIGSVLYQYDRPVSTFCQAPIADRLDWDPAYAPLRFSIAYTATAGMWIGGNCPGGTDMPAWFGILVDGVHCFT